MRVKFTNPETNEEIILEGENLDANKLKTDFKPIIPKDKLINFIENLSIPAEAKLILANIADFTITVGNTILNIGGKILEIILYMIKKFPNTATGAVVGSVMGMLISSIPILGWALGWLIAPLFIALGLACPLPINRPHRVTRLGV